VTGKPPAISLAGIDKRFGPVHANRDVSLDVAAGSIHGLVGENGAGKSTLMSILYGYYQADRGEIRVHGKPVRIRDSADAIAHGIGMVHQHFMLVDDFTVLENVVLGAEGGWRLGPGLAKARAELIRLERAWGLAVDPDARVGDLPVGARQRVEILKALYRGADILILDEPTAVLTPAEADDLIRVLHALKAEGRTVLLITHKLREVMAAADRVTVMRQGAVVADLAVADTSAEAIAELMVGRKMEARPARAAVRPGDVLLEVAGLRVVDDGGIERVRGVDFRVRAGEIVGIAGVSGNGQSELLEALAGLRPIAGGRVAVDGIEVPLGADGRLGDMRRHHLALVPEDRQRMGLITAFSVKESDILGYQEARRYNGPVLMKQDAIDSDCRHHVAAYDIRPADPEQRTALLSGGNQQKIVLAREIERDPRVLLVGQPTRGVDIGAIEFIHRRLLALRDQGKAILLVSVELDEILALADRILVMADGRIAGGRDAADADERSLGLMMTGVARDPTALRHAAASGVAG
jgi:simple sugar transport system ATP-binding protein